MVVNPQTSQQRLTGLDAALGALEAVFANKFSAWDENGHQTEAHFFERAYAATITAIYLIGEEDFEGNSPDKSLSPQFDGMFERVCKLLRLAEEYVTETTDDIKNGGRGLRPVHALLLADWARLCQRSNIRGCNGTNGLGKHLTEMIIRLKPHEPPVEDSWTEDGNDIKTDPEFDSAFTRFLELDDQMPRKRHGQIELYARASWLQLSQALRAVKLPEYLAEPPADFFHNEVRPTYVDYPCGSDEFLYGKGERPGILAVKQLLGGSLTEHEEAKIRAAGQKRIGSKTEESRNSKMPRLSTGASGALSGPVAKYMEYDRFNAAADLEDALREGSYQTGKSFPRRDDPSLMFPTNSNSVEILKTYGPKLRAIVNSHFKTRFSLSHLDENLPKTATERHAWLEAAEEEISLARGTIKLKITRVSSFTVARELRIAAFNLKLARSIYMVGLLSGTPAVSASAKKVALQDRLSDWILHEEAWNASDMHLLSRSRLTTSKQAAVNSDINSRKSNIDRWTGYIRQLDDSGGDSTKGSNIAAGHDEDDGAYAAAREESVKDGVPWLTEEQIETAGTILREVLNPRRPDRGDYLLDKRSESRRREWFDKMAVAKLLGEPVPAWTHKKVVDPFIAGGPPGHETLLPRDTVWDRVQYMWVLTYWRFYQLRHLEL